MEFKTLLETQSLGYQPPTHSHKICIETTSLHALGLSLHTLKPILVSNSLEKALRGNLSPPKRYAL